MKEVKWSEPFQDNDPELRRFDHVWWDHGAVGSALCSQLEEPGVDSQASTRVSVSSPGLRGSPQSGEIQAV